MSRSEYARRPPPRRSVGHGRAGRRFQL